MITHIVMWKLKEIAEDRTKAANAEIIKNNLEGLSKVIPQIKYIEVGINGDKGSSNNYDVVLISKFESFDDLEIYQKHPAHKEIGDFV